MFRYSRRVQFYETDAQGVVHHSNYFRYLEEARGEFLRSEGLPYSSMRKRGYEVVLLKAECEYKKALRYDDTFLIELEVGEISRYFFSFSYRILKEDSLVARALTRHCILKEGKLVSIPGEFKDILGKHLRA